MFCLLIATLLALALAAPPAAASASHFGFFGARLSLESDYFQDIGAGWVHVMLPYKSVYDQGTGTWKFQKHDDLYSQLAGRGAKLMVSFLPPDNIDKVRSKKFKRFLRRSAERYDGDGDCGCSEPAPDCYQPGDGLYPVWSAGVQPVVKFWQAGTEEDTNPYWVQNPSYYAEFLSLVYRKTNAACPDCRVLLGSSLSYYPSTEQLLFHQSVAEAGAPLDIVDIHLFGQMNRDHFAECARGIETLAALYPGKPVWMSETATYSDQPLKASGNPRPAQSELKQAVALFKRYVHFASLGVKKIFWDYLYETTFGPVTDGYFWYTGLVYDGEGYQDKGAHVKKLAYYTYKQMVRKLSPTGWYPLESSPAPNVYLYCFRNGNGRPLYVAWFDWFNEEGQSKEVRLQVGPLGTVTLTEAVPAAGTGQEVGDFETAFKTYSLPVDPDGYVTLILGKRPVYIE
jgi:hypothetical protein